MLPVIPSDHFVRFYNEVFKYLDEKDGLRAYYDEISRHQELHCLKDFQEKGLRGVYDYYVKIRKEENCDMDLILNGHELILKMNKCPSLSKALNNDAGACRKYCLHCPGWTSRVYKKAGLYQVYDLMGLENPQCCEWILDDLNAAKARYAEAAKSIPLARLHKNF